MTEAPPSAPNGEFPLRGHPGVPEGLLAYAQASNPDGTFAQDRSGNPKVRRVQLRADPPAEPERPGGLLTDSEWRWATSTVRHWATVTSTFGDRASVVALALARSGCVALDHDYRSGGIRQPPRTWTPHPALSGRIAADRDARRANQHKLSDRAAELREALSSEWPGVGEALAIPAKDPRLTWIVRAAEDLRADRHHDGARAFVQHHAGNTKARDDLPRLLADAGFEADALAILGVSRNPYVGLGGPLRARIGERTLDFSGWPGPHDIRLPANRQITASAAPGTRCLLVIENRQAAEAICDSYPAVALIWCHGQPPKPILDIVNEAAATVEHVVICPDADLGGVAIAGRIHDSLPASIRRTVIDIGTADHVPGPAFSGELRDRIRRFAGRDDSVGALARACLERGYVIEQEAPARSALRHIL